MEYAVVVDIQRFSLHDGPGIRTTVFFKGCALRCTWCQNPEALKLTPEMAFYAERCRNSGRCVAVCPEDAIRKGSMQRIDYDKCTSCGACAESCDHDALRLVGQRFDEKTLAEEILKDSQYFADSGGGVTLSGGEPMTHAAFLGRLLPLLKKEGVHVTIETCGMFGWAQMEPLLGYLDLVYFDLKHMDSGEHRRLTGAGNELILANFARLSASRVTLQARMPVIAGLNDGDENISALARFLKGHGQASLHCLAYHHLGEAKKPRLAPNLTPFNPPNLSPEELALFGRRLETEGIHAVCYD